MVGRVEHLYAKSLCGFCDPSSGFSLCSLSLFALVTSNNLFVGYPCQFLLNCLSPAFPVSNSKCRINKKRTHSDFFLAIFPTGLEILTHLIEAPIIFVVAHPDRLTTPVFHLSLKLRRWQRIWPSNTVVSRAYGEKLAIP